MMYASRTGLARAAALACTVVGSARADVVPAVGAGTGVLIVDDDGFPARTSLGVTAGVEAALPIRPTRWRIVPSITLGIRAGTQPMIGTAAELIALARRVGPVTPRLGVGLMQMVVEDSGRMRLVERGVAAAAAVEYRPRSELALVLALGRGWLGEATLTTCTIGIAWSP